MPRVQSVRKTAIPRAPGARVLRADWKIVMRVIRTDTRDLAAFGKAVLKMLEERK